ADFRESSRILATETIRVTFRVDTWTPDGRQHTSPASRATKLHSPPTRLPMLAWWLAAGSRQQKASVDCKPTSSCPFSELRLQLISPSTSPNELNTTLTPHSIVPGDACFAYFNKIWGIPRIVGGKVMMPADLKRLHKYMLDIEHIDHVSDEMRAVVES